MNTVRTCDCARPDLRNFDASCLGCGQTDSKAAPHLSYEQITTSIERHKPFSYKPLRSDSSFRLIRLYASYREDEIVCEVFHSTFWDHPPFEALSYTWGKMAELHKIYTTEGTANITMNCEAALRDLRYSFRDRILWIDALCIDQKNDEEKSKQVPLMSKIYSAARRVVIHVGGSDRQRDVDRFFAYLRGGEPTSITGDRVTQDAISSFLSKSWFSRVWVLQEVAVAKDALLMWGTATIDWTYFSAANLNALKLTPLDRSGKVPPVLLFARDGVRPLKDLVSLIHTARSCHSTEPRDKIYALLGLLDQVQHNLKPDYKKTVEILQSELVMSIVKSYNHLDILVLANLETEAEALRAKKLAAKATAKGSGVSFARRYIENAVLMVARSEKAAEVGIAYLLKAEKEGRPGQNFITYRGLGDRSKRQRMFGRSNMKDVKHSEKCRRD